MISFKLTDDSGFLAIVNGDRYESFVHEDWDLYQLMDHFVAEMNKENLVIWATGLENEWTVVFLPGPSARPAFREFTATIEVTAGRLYLTNYEDLTMVAQFADEKLPRPHQEAQYLELPDGRYALTIRQLYDPAQIDPGAGLEPEPHFEIIAVPAAISATDPIESIFWWEG
jgi:hypothetical protein